MRIDIDATGAGAFVTLPESPYRSIVGGAAARLVVVAPPTVVAAVNAYRVRVAQTDMETAWSSPVFVGCVARSL